MTSYNDSSIAEECCSCGKKTRLADLNKATSCEYFVCSGCATYHKVPWTLGYLCGNCYSKQNFGKIQKSHAALY